MVRQRPAADREAILAVIAFLAIPEADHDPLLTELTGAS
jgi:hypothetical protein